MASITEIAEQFFVACDEGKGWEGCSNSRSSLNPSHHPDFSFGLS